MVINTAIVHQLTRLACTKRIGMNTETFYANKTVTLVDWWLDEPLLPELAWARLRVFSDGASDVCFNGGKRYGFANLQAATSFLSEDEFTRLHDLDIADEQEFGIVRSQLMPPKWAQEDDSFEYIGDY